MPSSVIRAMRYKPEARTLEIVFRGGRGTYRYFDVPVEEWQRFRAATSKGTYLNEAFKTKEYRYEKVARGEKKEQASGDVLVWPERASQPAERHVSDRASGA